MATEENVPCCICGKYNYRTVLKNVSAGNLALCNECRLYFISPRRIDELIDSNSSELTKQELWNFKISEEQWRTLNFKKRLSLLERYCPGKGRLLDIGCYEGFFLREAQESGWDVRGVEARQIAAKYAQEKLKLNVIASTFEEADLPLEYFDVITMFHVLEHVSNPGEVLQKTFQLLKPGGLLVVEVPNIDTIWVKVFGKKWRHFSSDHYYFFGPDTLSKLLQKEGFSPLNIHTIGKSMSVGYFAGLLERIFGVDGLENFVAKAGLGERTISLNPGDIIISYSRKTHQA